MSRAILTPLRLPPELLEMAEKMLPLVTADPKVSAVGQVTRSSVLRMALAAGLESMQWKYAPKKKTGRGRRWSPDPGCGRCHAAGSGGGRGQPAALCATAPDHRPHRRSLGQVPL